eukprot:TRINITY_DN37766_c0_g1_i1.p1 TRINITY_DN37766_c0_g1~~TRINITY_DN37766_c0_g1_i1.p1  ORF type:complete len:143 (-),score=32.68 TRINITY_DN37766_c0_g1_i1:327-755(-)
MSDKLKSMKFMRRREEKDLRQSLIQEQEANKWSVQRTNDGARLLQAQTEGDPGSSFKTGRRSFGGFNKSVARVEEQLKDAREELKAALAAKSQVAEPKQKQKRKQEQIADVSSQEMAATMQKFKGNDGWRKKLKVKKEPQSV